MTTVAAWRKFLRSRAGVNFLRVLVIAAVLSAGLGYGFYRLSIGVFTASKGEEKITALQLIDAFVSNYTATRAALGGQAPVPATFRAHSIELFNQSREGDEAMRLVWVGRPGREIRTVPGDPAMAAAIEAQARETNPQPRSNFVTVNGQTVFRTVFPSVASQQACVACHNETRPVTPPWKLGDMMGAFALDVPVDAFLLRARLVSAGTGLLIFLLIGGLALMISIGNHRHLLERETAQAKIAADERRFRDFAEIASDWFWEQDEQLRFTYFSGPALHANQSMVPFVGKTRRDVAMGGVSDEQMRAHEADLAAHRPFHNFRFERVTAGGTRRYISVSGRPIFGADDAFQGYRGTARDVTTEVQTEIELARRVEERTAELRSAQDELVRNERLSVLGRLTATVAHEIRNPLSAIRNSIFALKEILASNGLTAERALTRIERSIARCDRIVSDLLDYARSRQLSAKPVPIDSWLAEVLDEQKLPAEIALTRRFEAEGAVLLIDVERFRRVIANLIENAAQAMMDASLGEGMREIELATRIDGGQVEIVVSDTGPGIAPDVLPRVFEPLFSTKSFGTGLGLPMVKQIVEQHGGSIAIESALGHGARALLRLPMLEVAEAAA